MRQYSTFKMHADFIYGSVNMPPGSTGLEIDTGSSGKPAWRLEQVEWLPSGDGFGWGWKERGGVLGSGRRDAAG